jgi:hypothetical protein
VGFAWQLNMPVRVRLNSLGAIAYNVSICVRAGLPKPRLVPDNERNKDTKTLDYASTPLDANTLLAVRAFFTDYLIEFQVPSTIQIHIPCVPCG